MSPVFIGGAPRSGTTLLRAMLGAHPHIFCPPEFRTTATIARLWEGLEQACGADLRGGYGLDGQDLRRAFADLLIELLTPAWRASGKARLAEKTPANVLVFPALLRLFPSCRLIEVVRDPRDVVASRFVADARTERGPRGAQAQAMIWAASVEAGGRARRDAPDRVRRIRYERLVTAPETEMRALLAFLGEDWSPAVLEHHRSLGEEPKAINEWSADQVRRPVNTDSIGRWRQVLTKAEAEAVMEIAGAKAGQWDEALDDAA
ncbi:sulfotransferase [Brevundimonas sp. 2R-24]|uniref:Sulfotransferase n=1 Tax=Peiella sedimenti TaxID=3061083 RepID=A0ABT8SNK7_9CAUL|nr:sulfotransferase [Caulobacteraceae bacterium XZ-24]